MPIHYVADIPQMKISCMGDIELLTFPPTDETRGVAWMTMAVGELGEPGREMPPDLEKRDLQKHEGLLLGFKDVRSIDAIVDGLRLLRGQLLDRQQGDGGSLNGDTRSDVSE